MPPIPFDHVAAAKNALSAALLAPPAQRPMALHVLGAFRAWSLLPEFDRKPEVLAQTPPLIHAVGMGRKMVNGKKTQTMAVRVYVTRKTPMAALAPTERVPHQIEGIPTDVIVAPPALFLGAPPACCATKQSQNRPAIGGISTSHISGDTGTLAYFCRSTAPADSPGDVFVLSNAHIYANYGGAQPGDALIQAGVVDSGTAADRIAGFHRGMPLIFGGARNDVDAAIGQLDPAIAHQLQICTIGKVNGTAAAQEDDVIAKHGRTTGYTEGTVDDELIDFIMAPHGSASYIQFRDQMRLVPRSPYTEIALGGDSGSLVVKTGEHEAVGLLHSAASDGSYAYANHFAKVMSLLQVALM